MSYPDFLSVKLALRIPIVSGIPDSLSCISDFTRIPGFRIPQAKFIEFRTEQIEQITGSYLLMEAAFKSSFHENIKRSPFPPLVLKFEKLSP